MKHAKLVTTVDIKETTKHSLVVRIRWGTRINCLSAPLNLRHLPAYAYKTKASFTAALF